MSDDLILDIRNLHLHFFAKEGVVKALNGINLPVSRWRILGIVGESGAGKSMTALSVLGLVPYPGEVVEGEILFEGRNLLSLSEEEMRQVRGREIAMIFQDPIASLNPTHAIGPQVEEAITAHFPMKRQEARERALEILARVGLPHPERIMGMYPYQLSGGMAQRVMIAMALALNPKLLFADEPTSALDVTIQAQILDFLRRLRHESDATLVVITHNFGVIAGIAEEVAVFYGGTVVERAETRELFKRPTHPYTWGLLQSLPRIDAARQALQPIRGSPPELLDLPEQCPFLPRCPKATSRCRVEPRPPLEEVYPGHWVACYNPIQQWDS